MTRLLAIDQDMWGHRVPASDPNALIDLLRGEVQKGLADFHIVAINHQSCEDAEGYERINVELAVTRELFDQFLNGNAGYRAQYAQGVHQGDAYSRAAVSAIIDMLVESNDLFAEGVDADLCRKSLEGSFTKFWFPKSLSDPSC